MTSPAPALKRLLAALALAGTAGAFAAPVTFHVTPDAFTPGAGYGVDASEAGGTLLDVSFSASGAAQHFTLANVGDSVTFTFGTITLNESGVVGPNETDDLGVLARFEFTDPLAGLRFVSAGGTATLGAINDPQIDFTIDWQDRQIAFGNGGLFQISMATSNFRQTGATREQTATITLLANPVPEPAGLALVATALLAGGLASRRRA